MVQKYQLAGKKTNQVIGYRNQAGVSHAQKTNYKQKFFKGMTLQQYIRGVNEFYQTIEEKGESNRGHEKVGNDKKPRTKTQLQEYPTFAFRHDHPSPINHSPLNKSVKLSTNRTIDPSSSLRLSKLAFPKLKMQNEGIKLEHIDPIHSKLHIIRPNKQQDNAKSLSKNYKPKKKANLQHSKNKEMPVPLNLKHQIKKCFIHLSSAKAFNPPVRFHPVCLITKAPTIE